MHPPGEPRLRIYVALFAATVLAAVVVMIGAFGPWIVDEHRRMAPWEVPWHWLGDVLALAWFCRFLLAHFVAGEPIAARPLHTGARRREGIAAAALILGGLADWGLAEIQIRGESRSYAAGFERAQADVDVVLRCREDFRLRCRFTDRTGRVWRTVVYASFRDGLPPTLEDALRRGHRPGPIPIRYAPDRPARAWLEGSPDGQYFGFFSRSILILQAIALTLWTAFTSDARARHAAQGMLPWWHDVDRLLPLTIEALAFVFIAVAFGWSWVPVT